MESSDTLPCASISAFRLGLSLTQRHLARQLNLAHDTLSDLENDLIQISKNSWTKYFKDLIKP